MRTLLALAAVALITAARADDPPRHAERTPPVRGPLDHTLERAGHPNTVARWARPGVEPHDAGGYVGGGTLKGNRPLSKAFGGLGPTDTGTFGWDYAGFGGRTGRLFLAPSAGRHHDRELVSGYRAEGREVLDVFSLRPVRRSVVEYREEYPGHKGHPKE